MCNAYATLQEYFERHRNAMGSHSFSLCSTDILFIFYKFLHGLGLQQESLKMMQNHCIEIFVSVTVIQKKRNRNRNKKFTMRSNIFNLKAAAQTTAYGSQAATTALLTRLPALGNHSNVIRVDEDLQYDLCKVFSQRCINFRAPGLERNFVLPSSSIILITRKNSQLTTMIEQGKATKETFVIH